MPGLTSEMSSVNKMLKKTSKQFASPEEHREIRGICRTLELLSNFLKSLA